VLLAEGSRLDIAHFPSIGRGRPSPAGVPVPSGLPLRELEKWYILETLQQVGGNRSRAAKILQISVRGLQYKLRRYIEDESRKPRARPGRSPHLTAQQERRPPRIADAPSKTA
jgi:DNA-binding NtrC family response regulator